jgi:hypothetical protein
MISSSIFYCYFFNFDKKIKLIFLISFFNIELCSLIEHESKI